MNNPENLIKKLNLKPHPEGGHFAESFRDNKGNVSLIYYFLKKNEVSHWHKLTKNEILHFYAGSSLTVYHSNGKKIHKVILGNQLNKKEKFHYVIKKQTWFSMKTNGKWSLIGCTVAPAFNYKDFKLAKPSWSPKKL